MGEQFIRSQKPSLFSLNFRERGNFCLGTKASLTNLQKSWGKSGKTKNWQSLAHSPPLTVHRSTRAKTVQSKTDDGWASLSSFSQVAGM
jgi:hypothetical protein